MRIWMGIASALLLACSGGGGGGAQQTTQGVSGDSPTKIGPQTGTYFRGSDGMLTVDWVTDTQAEVQLDVVIDQDAQTHASMGATRIRVDGASGTLQNGDCALTFDFGLNDAFIAQTGDCSAFAEDSAAGDVKFGGDYSLQR